MAAWRKSWNNQYNKKYYQENIDKERLRTRNKPKEAVRRYAKKQMLKPNRKLRSSVSSGIRFHIKKCGLSHLKFVDWTYQELRSHIESQFEPWMNWENYGRYNLKTWDDNDSSTWTWQIDHIIPHSTFHYDSMDCQEFRDCWALKNLRPYSSKQNNLDKDRKLDRAA
jgi:cytolysin (calcineurin-like family phosphatase)